MIFKLSAAERLHRWRLFRNNINSLSLESALTQTLNFWEYCPFNPFYLDPEQVHNWPNPWELIEENCYCDLAKALGIIYTLHLTDHSNLLEPELRVYFDTNTKYTYHIAYLCQGKYVLNLVEGEILNKKHINPQLILKYQFTATDLKLEKY